MSTTPMKLPMSARSREIRANIAGLSRLPNAYTREIAKLRSEFTASRLEDHIREVRASLTVAQLTHLVAVLLEDDEGEAGT
jgi:hypothetical protein